MSEYEIYAIRYARKDERRSSENFVGGDAADTPMPLDFFVWALVSKDRTVIVDTGFDEPSGKPRGYAVSRPVAEGLKQIDIDPAGVKDVIFPAENRQNVEEDLTADQIENVRIHYASRIEDVLAVALPKSVSEEKKDEAIRENIIEHAEV